MISKWKACIDVPADMMYAQQVILPRILLDGSKGLIDVNLIQHTAFPYSLIWLVMVSTWC